VLDFLAHSHGGRTGDLQAMTIGRRSPIFVFGLVLGVALLVSGCASLSAAFDNTMCAIGTSGVPLNLENAIEREVAGGAPNGAFGQTPSRENWDRFWNDRIYSLWDSVPDCGNAPRGPTGREAVLAALSRRSVLGLPDIELEERNRDKDLQI